MLALPSRRAVKMLTLFAAFVPLGASASESAPSREEVEAWLEARALPDTQRDQVGDPNAPPPAPPRHRGFVLEAGLGALGHWGSLANISGPAPRFHLRLGLEPFPWLLVFGESDLTIASTSRAPSPPETRGYALYGFGAGIRGTWEPTRPLGLFLQGSLGAARVSRDVLRSYGFSTSDGFNAYVGADLGLEWYQINPHYALALHFGMRSYPQGLATPTYGGSALAWLGGLAVRYAL